MRDARCAMQIERFALPCPGEARRLWDVDAEGRIADAQGKLLGEEP
ncbi:hypothetical protein [Sorangium sp. So ce426]